MNFFILKDLLPSYTYAYKFLINLLGFILFYTNVSVYTIKILYEQWLNKIFWWMSSSYRQYWQSFLFNFKKKKKRNIYVTYNHVCFQYSDSIKETFFTHFSASLFLSSSVFFSLLFVAVAVVVIANKKKTVMWKRNYSKTKDFLIDFYV